MRGARRERRFALVKKGEKLSNARKEGRGGWITYTGAKASARNPSDRVVPYVSDVNRWGAELDPYGERLPVETLGKSTWHGPAVSRGHLVVLHGRSKRRMVARG